MLVVLPWSIVPPPGVYGIGLHGEVTMKVTLRSLPLDATTGGGSHICGLTPPLDSGSAAVPCGVLLEHAVNERAKTLKTVAAATGKDRVIVDAPFVARG